MNLLLQSSLYKLESLLLILYRFYDNNKNTKQDNSIITSKYVDFEYLFFVQDGSFFDIKNSQIQECGFNDDNPGLTINSENVNIENSIIYVCLGDDMPIMGAIRIRRG